MVSHKHDLCRIKTKNPSKDFLREIGNKFGLQPVIHVRIYSSMTWSARPCKSMATSISADTATGNKAASLR
jgi:hypothetical protein